MREVALHQITENDQKISWTITQEDLTACRELAHFKISELLGKSTTAKLHCSHLSFTSPSCLHPYMYEDIPSLKYQFYEYRHLHSIYLLSPSRCAGQHDKEEVQAAKEMLQRAVVVLLST